MPSARAGAGWGVVQRWRGSGRTEEGQASSRQAVSSKRQQAAAGRLRCVVRGWRGAKGGARAKSSTRCSSVCSLSRSQVALFRKKMSEPEQKKKKKKSVVDRNQSSDQSSPEVRRVRRVREPESAARDAREEAQPLLLRWMIVAVPEMGRGVEGPNNMGWWIAADGMCASSSGACHTVRSGRKKCHGPPSSSSGPGCPRCSYALSWVGCWRGPGPE